MTSYACLFEAKSIQDYILRSGRLRHIVGASELIDSLTRDLLDDTLKALALKEGADVHLSRRAGGAVYLFSASSKARDGFRDLWSALVRQYAPNLEFVAASGHGDSDYDAYLDASRGLQAARNRQPAWLPAGTPVTAYAPRTGNPAVRCDRKLGLQDAATARFGTDRFWRSGKLTDKFARAVPVDRWPRNLEHRSEGDGSHFPFLPDNRYLAIVHADGNGLGQVLRQLGAQARTEPGHFVALFRDFSEAVAEATQDAARQATEQILLSACGDEDGPVPARPIVLGGDDLTLLVRADLALAFTETFLRAFEDETQARLGALRGKYPQLTALPSALTAGAGIAFVKSSHPFHLAHALAESLAKYAKQAAKGKLAADERIAPTIAYHRVTTASHGDYQDILEQEMTFGTRAPRIRTTLGVYGIDPSPPQGLPALADLQTLVDLLAGEGMARGPARQILSLLGQDRDDARRRYVRWREVMADRHRSALDKLDASLERLLPGGPAADLGLPVSGTGDLRVSPLGDVSTLLAVTRGGTRHRQVTEEVSA